MRLVADGAPNLNCISPSPSAVRPPATAAQPTWQVGPAGVSSMDVLEQDVLAIRMRLLFVLRGNIPLNQLTVYCILNTCLHAHTPGDTQMLRRYIERIRGLANRGLLDAVTGRLGSQRCSWGFLAQVDGSAQRFSAASSQ